MVDRDRLHRALLASQAQRFEAANQNGPRAAVASVFRAGEVGTELLFIERARRVGDPWSGHVAFPGGRTDPTDPHSQATAERETREELGLDLSLAEPLGQLGDLAGRKTSGREMTVAAHVYWWPLESPVLTPNYEVADAFWVDLRDLLDPDRYVDYRYPLLPLKKFPGIRLGRDRRRVVWGLTFRFLEDLFRILEQPFPLRP